MTARQTGIVAFCAGLAGFALAFFAFDPSRIILGESAARVRKLERTALDLRKAMYARIAQTRTRVVDVAPKPLDAKHFSVVDTRPSWAFLSFRSGATRFLYDVGTNTFNGRYSTTPIARYGWKAVISNNGDKAADLYAYVRIIDRSGQTVTGDLLQVKLPPFTARRFRGLVNYLPHHRVGPMEQWQEVGRDVSIVFDPDEIEAIQNRDFDRWSREQAFDRSVQ